MGSACSVLPAHTDAHPQDRRGSSRPRSRRRRSYLRRHHSDENRRSWRGRCRGGLHSRRTLADIVDWLETTLIPRTSSEAHAGFAQTPTQEYSSWISSSIKAKHVSARHRHPRLQGRERRRRTFDEAVRAADAAGYPVVVKAQVQVAGRGRPRLSSSPRTPTRCAPRRNILGMDIKGHASSGSGSSTPRTSPRSTTRRSRSIAARRSTSGC